MTLTEFLLDRIAEDEKLAHATLTAIEEQARLDGFHATRMLIECEAKRQIVELLEDMPEKESRWMACLILADIYADHPDYLPEWSVS